jgi:hypothetical protein
LLLLLLLLLLLVVVMMMVVVLLLLLHPNHKLRRLTMAETAATQRCSSS